MSASCRSSDGARRSAAVWAHCWAAKVRCVSSAERASAVLMMRELHQELAAARAAATGDGGAAMGDAAELRIAGGGWRWCGRGEVEVSALV